MEFRLRVARGAAFWLSTAAAIFVLAACSGVDKNQQALAQMKWELGPSDVKITITADPDLNLYNDKRHTVLLAVCQVADPNMFLSQLGNQAAIAGVLESGQTPAVALAGFNRFVISPGQRNVLTMDRAAMAQYVGVVAGYYNLNPPGVARLFVVPVELETHGWFFKTVTASPQPLNVSLDLGANQISSGARAAPQVDGQIVAIPGEQDGVIPITVAGIANAQTSAAPTVIALPAAAPPGAAGPR